MMTLIWSLTLQMNFYLEILVNTDRLDAGAGLGPARLKSTFLITAPFTRWTAESGIYGTTFVAIIP